MIPSAEQIRLINELRDLLSQTATKHQSLVEQGYRLEYNIGPFGPEGKIGLSRFDVFAPIDLSKMRS